jgi:hypothetical protein
MFLEGVFSIPPNIFSISNAYIETEDSLAYHNHHNDENMIL